jgi:uncharacterized protein YkwD
LGTASGDKPKASPNNTGEQDQVSSLEEHLIRYTNSERVQQGLLPLELSRALTYVARRHSENMCRTRTFEHESDAFPQGWEDFLSRLKAVGLMAGGENIAYQTITRDPQRWAREMVHGWMNSPRHRKNILHPQFRYTGVGIQLCENRLGYATQVFSPHPGRLTRDVGHATALSETGQ